MIRYRKGGYKGLAIALVQDALKYIKREGPSYVDEGEQRQKDLEWILDPSRSARWFEMAGLDYGAAISHLEAQGVLDGPEEKDG